MGNSLGFIEVEGMLGAIKACDVAIKAANVELVGCELTKGGGWVTITVKGNVGAVDAAVASVEKVTKVIGRTVIARPSKGLEKINKKGLLVSKEKKSTFPLAKELLVEEPEAGKTIEPKKVKAEIEVSEAKVLPVKASKETKLKGTVKAKKK